jgi:hypothetical protein
MLIKIDNTIINTANIVSVNFTPGADNQEAYLLITCVNNVEPTNSLGTIHLKDDAAEQVWDVLCREATSASPR